MNTKTTALQELSTDERQHVQALLQAARVEAVEYIEEYKEITLIDFYKDYSNNNRTTMYDYEIKDEFKKITIVKPSRLRYGCYEINNILKCKIADFLNSNTTDENDRIERLTVSVLLERLENSNDLFQHVENQKRDFKKLIKELKNHESIISTCEYKKLDINKLEAIINDAKSLLLEDTKEQVFNYIIHITNNPINKLMCSVSRYFTSCYDIRDGGYRSSALFTACDPRMSIVEFYPLDILTSDEVNLKDKIARCFIYDTVETKTVFKLYPFSNDGRIDVPYQRQLLDALGYTSFIEARDALFYSSNFKGYDELGGAYTAFNTGYDSIEKRRTMCKFDTYLLDYNEVYDFTSNDAVTLEEAEDVAPCNCCGGLYDADDLTYISGTGDVCQDCLVDHYFYCDVCGEYVNEDDHYSYTMDDRTICDGCIREYVDDNYRD